MVIPILLSIILIFVILIWFQITWFKDCRCECKRNISTFSNLETYTKDEILQLWEKTQCANKLQDSVVNLLIKLPKKNAERAIDNFYKKMRNICGIPYKKVSFSPLQINELKNMWNQSLCPGPFPLDYINRNYYNISFNNAKIRFNKYIQDVLSNVKNNDVSAMDLDKSYATCYGDKWKENENLLKQYNELI